MAMANTTFNGPVRSENGFQTVTKSATTGAETIISKSAAAIANPAGAGITAGTGTVYKTSVKTENGIVTTTIMMDLTGLQSGGTAGDIIGVNGSANPAWIARITAADSGTIFGVKMTCYETPAGGDTDIDLYSATEATGVEDGAIGSLTETQIINSGALTAGSVVYGGDIAANQYLYLVGQGTANAAYTAGRLLIEIYGYA
jgi:hypothetical protein